jgi:hypothetical protein
MTSHGRGFWWRAEGSNKPQRVVQERIATFAGGHSGRPSVPKPQPRDVALCQVVKNQKRSPSLLKVKGSTPSSSLSTSGFSRAT